MNKKILIIGGDSFIASKFIDKNKGVFDIKVVSRKKMNFVHEIVMDDFFKIHDSSFKYIDVVINFAAIVHQTKIKDDALYNRINCELPIYIAKKAKDNGVKHFIQMSTIAVYGDLNFINENSIENPISPYGISKFEGDKELMKMSSNKFIISCIRPPMVYGGGKAPGNMMKLIRVSLKGFYLPFKNLNNLRDFLNVNNLVDSIVIIINNKLSGVIIPTDMQPVSTESIVRIACDKANAKCQMFSIPKVLVYILRRAIPSIYNKIYGSLRVECNIKSNYYKPKHSVSDGISEMVNHLKD